MSQNSSSCPVKGCTFVNHSGGKADLNYHISTAHPQEWKKRNVDVNKEAKSHMQHKFGKDYVRKTAQKEAKKKRR